jgi:hypothetical protein
MFASLIEIHPHTRRDAAHVPTSKIYLQACVVHASVLGGWIKTMLVTKGSGEAQERGGVVDVSLWLLEMSRFDFEKPNPRISRNE